MKDFILIGLIPTAIFIITSMYIAQILMPNENNLCFVEVTSEGANIRSNQLVNSDNIISIAKKGDRFPVKEKLNNKWIAIYLKNYKEGFIARSTINIVEDSTIITQPNFLNNYYKIPKQLLLGIIALSLTWLWFWYPKKLPEPRINKVFFAKPVNKKILLEIMPNK